MNEKEYNLPALKETIQDFERNRNTAISKLEEAYHVLQDALIFAHKATRGINENTIHLSDEMKKHLVAYEGRKSEYYEEDKRPPKAKFLDLVTKSIDKSIWEHVIESSELDKLFDRQARKEFTDSLVNDCLPFTVQTCMSTVNNLLESSGLIFSRGIANSFSSLDRRFKSHDGFKIGSRMIFDNAFSDWGGWNYHRKQEDNIRDVERAFYQLDGKENPEKYAGLVGIIDEKRKEHSFGKSKYEVESDYFKARIFKNGNLHLWFKRDDILKKVNLILADYYGEVIGESSEVANPSDIGPSYHITPAKNFGYFPTSQEVADKLFSRLPTENLKDMKILEPSAGCGMLARNARDRGGDVTCIEIQENHCLDLKNQRFNTIQDSFLECKPSDIGYYDLIIMNPPFDNGRDSDHVRHALQFLKKDGILISIMSASAELSSSKRHSSLRDYINKNYKPLGWSKDFFSDLPSGSFKHCGTNVNTIILSLRNSK